MIFLKFSRVFWVQLHHNFQMKIYGVMKKRQWSQLHQRRQDGNMTFFEKLTNRQPRVFYVLFCETNQKNKFVNEENNLYQDLVGSHKATMLQFLHLSQVKNFHPLWFLWFLCPCHKVATTSFLDFVLNDCRYWVDYWCVIVSWWVTD